MALIKTLEALRLSSVGWNDPTEPFAKPETPGDYAPGAEWQQRGYLGDDPVSKSGWTNNFGIDQAQPWYVIADIRSGNPARDAVYYQVRAPRGYRRRRLDKVWVPVPAGRAHMEFINDHQLAASEGNPRDQIHPDPVAKRVAPSGGLYLPKRVGYTLHGYPMNRDVRNAANGDYGTYDAFAFLMQGRCVPRTRLEAPTDGYPWADSTAQMNVGADNYVGGTWQAEVGHSRFERLTNRWKIIAMMGIKNPDMTQPSGIEYADFLDSVFPWEDIPEEEVWIENGAFNAGANKQTLVLKRSAPAPTNRTYTLTKLPSGGTFMLPMSQVVMSAGQSSVQFDVDTPGGAVPGVNYLYVTDGGNEDFWHDFEIEDGGSTGDPGGGGSPTFTDTTRTNRLLRTTDLANAAWSKPDGSTVGTADGDGWQLLTSGTEYVQQAASGFTVGEDGTLAIDLKPDASDWALVRLGADDYSNGRNIFLNAATGAVGMQTGYGALASVAAVVNSEAIAGGGYRFKLKLPQDETTRRVSIRAVAADNTWNPWASGVDKILVRRPQWQSGAKGTRFIPTTTAAVTRTLTTTDLGSPTPVSAGAPSFAIVTLLDDNSEPWDQYAGGVDVVSNFPGILAVTPNTGATDAAGELTFVLAALAAGNADLIATAAGISSSPLSVTVEAAGADLDVPDAPDITVLNSDTIEVDVTGIDAAATHVDILAKDLTTIALPVVVATVAKGDLPVQVTDLAVGRAYRFSARSKNAATASVESEATDATTHRLFAFCHIEPESALSGVRVAAGRIPTAGILPSEIYGFSDSAEIDPGPYTLGEDSVSRIVLQLHQQPAGGKIRSGDPCVMIAFKEITPNVSIGGIGLDYSAVIAEGP